MGLILELADVRREYDGRPALNGCTGIFSTGGVTALMGPNGSGKSTILRLCSLLEPPDTGEVIYRSESGAPPAVSVPPWRETSRPAQAGLRPRDDSLPQNISLRRRITLVLPGIGVFNDTVSRNVEYGLRIRGFEQQEAEERVARALEAVGLAHKQQHNALTLSSGETQRLGIARAMVIEPEILFLDEPTAAIDEENKAIVEDSILTMKQEGRTTVIIATHDREQAEKLADRVILMRNGVFMNE